MSTGWVLIVSVTAAASGVAKYGLHLWGERARYRHEQALERQRQAYLLLVLRQRAAAPVKIAAMVAGAAPPADPEQRPAAVRRLPRADRIPASPSDRGPASGRH